MRASSVFLLPLLVTACVTEAECLRRNEAAGRDAMRDAPICRWEPDALLQPECAGLDRRPLHTYTGVFCATADLPTCIEARPEIWYACFGGPDDTPPDTDSDNTR